MTMEFNATTARETVKKVQIEREENARKCAENVLIHMVEPAIRKAAKSGDSQLEYHCAKGQPELYGNICLFLHQNGYEVHFNRERTIMYIKW